MSAFRSTADLARNDPEAYELLDGTPDLTDDSEIVVIQPDATLAVPTVADIAAMHAERPNDLDPVLKRFADLANALEDLADHVDASSPAGRINALCWAATQIRRVLAEVKK